MNSESTSFSDSIPSRFPCSWDFVAGITPILAVSPALFLQSFVLWRTPETCIGILVWLICIAIIALRYRGSLTKHRLRFAVAVITLLISAAVGVLGVVNWSLSLIQLSAIGSLTAWGLGRCSRTNWFEIVGLGGLLVLTVPIPVLHQVFDNWLTEIAGRIASVTLDAHGVPNFVDGLKLTLQNGQVSISAATSTKLGLYVVVGFTGIWSWLRSRSLFHSLLLLISSAACLLVIRYLAILLVSWGLHRYSADWTTSSTPHYLISFSAFAAILLLVSLCDLLLLELLQPIPNSHPSLLPLFVATNNIMRWPIQNGESQVDDSPEFASFQANIQRWQESWYSFDWRKSKVTKGVSFLGCSLFGLLGLPIYLAAFRSGVPTIENPVASLDLTSFSDIVRKPLFASRLGNCSLKVAQINGLELEAADQSLSGRGNLYCRAVYDWNGANIHFEIFSPQLKWITPAQQISTKTTTSIEKYHPSFATEHWSYMECCQSNKLTGNTYIFQSFLSDNNTPVVRDEETSKELAILEALNGKKTLQPMYEIRLIFESGQPLDPSQLDDLKTIFDQGRNHIRSQLPSGRLASSLIANN